MPRGKPKFRVGQVVGFKRDESKLFKITKVIPCWDRGASENDTHPDRYEYRDIWTMYREENLRPLSRRESGHPTGRRK